MTVEAEWQPAQGNTFATLRAGQADAAKFEFLSDLEPSAGGAGTAPTPHDLLAASLAACTVLTLQLYSKRKQMPLESVRVTVDQVQLAGELQLDRRVYLSGPLSDQAISDCLRIANACPIHKALQGKFSISTELG